MRAQKFAFRPRCEQLESRDVPSAGMLDPSFSGDGIASASFGTTYALGHDVAVLADGSVLAVGGNVFSSPPQFAVAKFRPDGSPDPTFGTGGQVLTNVGSLSDQANCVAVQPDGKIVVGGYTNAGKSDLYTSGKRNYAFALVRYHPNGALDTSFGKSGVVQTDLANSADDQIHDVALRPDGKIVVVGQSGVNMAVARYTTAGQLDKTFDGDGLLVVPKLNVGEVLNAVALLPDGRIVASGSHVATSTQTEYDNRGLLVRFGANGGLDSTFGAGGRVVTPYDVGGFTAVAIRSDGRVVAGGSTSTNTHFIAQYTATGTLDTTFGDDPDGDGVRTGSILAPFHTAWVTDLAIDSAGRIAAVGAVESPDSQDPTASWDFDFAVFRYTADGDLDGAFGTGGVSIADPSGTGGESFDAVAIMADGRIVAAGTAYDPVGQRTTFAVARYLGDEPPQSPPPPQPPPPSGNLTEVTTDPSAPNQNALFVNGTSGDDTIAVQRGTTAAFINVVINGVSQGQFPVTSNGKTIGRIIVYGHDGNDNITINQNIGTIDQVVYGGAGNDTITGGTGSLYADGGDGNDTITGKDGNNILIGGAGTDTLNGAKGDDILIGGVYLFSENLDAVFRLMGVWKSTMSYANRVADIRTGGADGLYAMTAATVIDDGAADHLNGKQGQDWFWSYLLDVDDKKSNETNQ